MKQITVDKDNLKLLVDDIDELANYIEELVNWSYDYGYASGYDAKAKDVEQTTKYDLMDREYNI